MKLKRHIDKWLSEWKDNPEHKPALVRGIRQSGKTHSVIRFAESNYTGVVCKDADAKAHRRFYCLCV